MSRRSILAVTGLGAVLVAALLPLTSRAAQPPACQPAVTSVDPAVAGRGQHVTVHGSQLGCGGSGGSGGSASVTVGGHPQEVISAADDTLVFAAGGETGGVQVALHDPGCAECADTAHSDADHLLLAAPVPDGGTRTPVEGAGFSVTGSGFDFGGHREGVSAGACGGTLAVAAAGDTEIALTAPRRFCDGAISLTFTVFTTVQHTGTAVMSVHDGFLDVAPTLSRVSTDRARPGEVLTVTGSGFGTAGSAFLGGASLPSTWSDGAVALTVQPASTSGELELVRGDGRSIDAGRLNVVAPPARAPVTAGRRIPPTPTPTPRGPVGVVPSPAAPPPPRIPASPPSRQVAVALHSDRPFARTGLDVPVTVHLTSLGSPVAGAPVELLLAADPGGDATVTPARGVTDAAGEVLATVHLSRRPGDHMVLVRSGAYSDEIRLVGMAPEPATAPPVTGAERGAQTAIVAGLVACLALFLSGFVINLATAPRAPQAD
jgi:hypothetical protein